MRCIDYDSIEKLCALWHVVQDEIEAQGFAILNGNCVDRRHFAEVMALFGKLVDHNRAAADGIVRVCSKDLVQDKSDIATDKPFPPHTDGYYLAGRKLVDGVIHQRWPPRFVGLQCVQAAVIGGETNLIDGQDLLEDVIFTAPDLLPALFSKCHTRDNQLIGHIPTFSYLPSGNLCMRFNAEADRVNEFRKPRELADFERWFVGDPRYSISFKLRAGQILILDNHRMLHGRDVVVGNRLLHRAWVQEGPHIIRQQESQTWSDARPLHSSGIDRNFDHFRPLRIYETAASVTTGICLSTPLAKRLERALSTRSLAVVGDNSGAGPFSDTCRN